MSGAAGGFAGWFTGSLLNGGNLGDAVKAGVIGGLSAGAASKVGSFFGHEIGTFQKELASSLAHGSIGGLASMAQGGKFKHGFFAGSFASMAGSGMQASKWGVFQTTAGGTVTAAVVGGTASALGGGKFANGAVTGAYTMLFNHMAHKVQEKNKYKNERYSFEGTTIAGDPDQDIGTDLSPSQSYRGTIEVKKHGNGRWYAEAFAEVFPGEKGGNKISANIRVIQDGKEVGFQYLSLKNEWGQHYHNATWKQLGYGRLYLPTTGNVSVHISIYTYQDRFFLGSTSHILYNGYIKLP